MDSMGLGAIIAATKRILERDGSLRVASASRRIMRVFELTGLADTYEFLPSVEEATGSAPVPGSLAEWPHAS
jgi:anti-sigma B factor antagonist